MAQETLNETFDERRLFSVMMLRVDDAQLERQKHERQWSDNVKLSLGDHRSVFAPGKHRYFTINRVSQIVDSHVAIMTEETPMIGFEPRELGDAPDWFVKIESAGKFQVLAEIGVDVPLDEDQLSGDAPIPDQVAMGLMSVTVPQTATAPDAEGNPVEVEQQVPVFTEDDFFKLDASLEAELLADEVANQSLTMAHWESRITENIHGAQVVGHKDIMVEWNADEHHVEFKNLYPYNVWIDPWANDTSDAEYYIVREFLPESQAIAEYPHLKELIERVGGSPHNQRVGSSRSGGKFERSLHRKSVARWTWWQRNAPIPLTEDEAVASGKVEPLIEQGLEAMTDPETGEDLFDPETGQTVTEPVENPVTDEEGNQVYTLVETGEQTRPGDPNWPFRKGLRQIQFLHDVKVMDIESPFVDIPAARSKAILIDDSPYAMGEPARVAELNDLLNQLYSIYYGYTRRFRSPEQIIPADVYEASREAVESLHADFSKKWVVDPMLWQQYGGDIIRNLEAPQLGTVVSEMIAAVQSELDRIGMTDVLRGETKSDQSGELFRQALEAARGPIGLKSRNVARALKYLGRVVAYLIIDFMPPEVWAQRNTVYPEAVYRRLKERLSIRGVNVVPQVSGSEPTSQRISELNSMMQLGIQTPTLLRNLLAMTQVKDREKIVGEWLNNQALASQPTDG